VHTNGTSIIPEEQIDLFRVDYVEITQLSDFYGRLNLWPDPLYPISSNDSIGFTSGVNQPVWIRIKIPSSAIPGTYAGSVAIGEAIIPFTLTVWDFYLPAQQFLANRIGFDWDLVMETYRGTNDGVKHACYEQLEAAILETLSEYRLTPEADPPNGAQIFSLTAYEVNKAQRLQQEESIPVWWKYTAHDSPPHINPAVIDRPGVDSRILPLLAWLDRLDGIYYPQSADWNPTPWANPYSNDLSNGDSFYFYPPRDDTLGFDPCNPNSNRLIPSIRLELLREGLEDYAYLWLLNQGSPEIDHENPSDLLVMKLVNSRTQINKIPTAIGPVRHEIAAMLEAQQEHIYLPLLYH
jgi:hypothetical protein